MNTPNYQVFVPKFKLNFGPQEERGARQTCQTREESTRHLGKCWRVSLSDQGQVCFDFRVLYPSPLPFLSLLRHLEKLEFSSVSTESYHEP